MIANETLSSYFRTQALDDSPALMEQSYALRYHVYCRERNFLPADDYPTGLEKDRFDQHSVHVGVLDAWGDLAATARVVSLTKAGPGLPLFHHCRIFADETELLDPDNNVVEISRLAMSRRYRRRPQNGVPERRDVRRQAFLTLLKGIYQATKRMEATHWLAATEESLQRLVEQYGFPFRVIGPQVNYGGPVAPYLMNLAEFDKTILSGRIPILEEFLDGLEPEFHPLNPSVWRTGSFAVSNTSAADAAVALAARP
jgi:N-acyl amino acid synthase of PEP-CTERM/exosortase system